MPMTSLCWIANQSCHETSPNAVGLSVAKVMMSALPSPLTSPVRGRSYVLTATKPCHCVGALNPLPVERATKTRPWVRATEPGRPGRRRSRPRRKDVGRREPDAVDPHGRRVHAGAE